MDVNPVSLALLLNSLGFYICRPCPNFESLNHNKFSSALFASSVVVVLLNSKTFYSALAKPAPWPLHALLKFLGAAYIIEMLQYSLWFPLEATFLHTIPAWTDKLDKMCDETGTLVFCVAQRLTDVFAFLCVSEALSLASSSLLLACCLHMTNQIDLHMLWRCGPKRLVALLVQVLMRSVGIETLVCSSEYLLRMHRPVPASESCGVKPPPLPLGEYAERLHRPVPDAESCGVKRPLLPPLLCLGPVVPPSTPKPLTLQFDQNTALKLPIADPSFLC